MDNSYNSQLVQKLCECCGNPFIGHPSRKYCYERNCRDRAKRLRRKQARLPHIEANHYRSTETNPSPEKFLLLCEIHSKGHNQKPTKIYNLAPSLVNMRLPANVELMVIPPDGIRNNEGITFWILTNCEHTTTAMQPTVPIKHFNAFDILNKHLPSTTSQVSTNTIGASKQIEFREVLHNPTPDEVFAVCNYYAEEVNDLRPTKVFGEPPKTVPEHVEVHNFPADTYYILQPL